MRVPLGQNKAYGWEVGGHLETHRWLLRCGKSRNGPDTEHWIPSGRVFPPFSDS